MSSNGETKLSFDPVLRPFADLWSDYTRQVNEATRELFSGFDEGAQIKTWQRKWMNAISQSMDAYMRTPEFLQAMKHHTETAVQLKRKADDWASEIARNANIPTTGDISGLFERLRSIEDGIVQQLKRIDERLELMEAQLSGSQLAH